MRNFNAKLTPLFFCSLLRVCVHGLILGVVLSVGNAQGTDNPMPTQVKRLIGMKIPAVAPGKSGGIPGWKYLGAGNLSEGLPGERVLGYELVYRGDITIFAISSLDGDYNKVILDARELPGQLLEYGNINGKAVLAKNTSQVYQFELSCNPSSDEEMTVGLVRAERGNEHCGHLSTRVKRAWSVNLTTGRILDRSPVGVSCPYEAESFCP